MSDTATIRDALVELIDSKVGTDDEHVLVHILQFAKREFSSDRLLAGFRSYMANLEGVRFGTLSECIEEKPEYILNLPQSDDHVALADAKAVRSVMSCTGTAHTAIKIIVHENDKFNFAFVYGGDRVSELKSVLRRVYGDVLISVADTDVIVPEYVVSGRDEYEREFYKLERRDEMKPFVNNISPIVFKLVDPVNRMASIGVEHGSHNAGSIVIQNIQIIHNHQCDTVNITQPHTPQNETEKKIAAVRNDEAANHLQWVKSNTPTTTEKRSAYIVRMRAALPAYTKSNRVHNRVLRGLGYEFGRGRGGIHVWVEK